MQLLKMVSIPCWVQFYAYRLSQLCIKLRMNIGGDIKYSKIDNGGTEVGG